MENRTTAIFAGYNKDVTIDVKSLTVKPDWANLQQTGNLYGIMRVTGGNDVVINVDRWNNATEGWLNAGGTVSRYRTMVINHEVGHRLGHLDNELTCPAVNQPAPLMQQQSMDLLGCVPNEWPLDEELWVSE